MKKRVFGLVCRVRAVKGREVLVCVTLLLCLASPVLAQWNCSGANCTTTGNVGIGTSSPGKKLDIISGIDAGLRIAASPNSGYGFIQFGQSGTLANNFHLGTEDNGTFSLWNRNWGAGTHLLTVNSSGNVGIGTTNPTHRLEVIGPAANGPGNEGLWVDNNGVGFAVRRDAGGGGNLQLGTPAYHNLLLMASGTTRMYIDATSGNVGVGTTAPQYKLSVNGTIGTKEVVVTNAGWPDYVFAPGYRLRPLGEVQSYIREHLRLPDLPSAAEVQKNGVGLAQMQVKLLAKIEELTLHAITAEQRNDRLEQRNRELQDRVARLEAILKAEITR